jgi:hypothetical protein
MSRTRTRLRACHELALRAMGSVDIARQSPDAGTAFLALECAQSALRAILEEAAPALEGPSSAAGPRVGAVLTGLEVDLYAATDQD